MSAVRMDGKALSAKVRGSILAETEEPLRAAQCLSERPAAVPAQQPPALLPLSAAAPLPACLLYTSRCV